MKQIALCKHCGEMIIESNIPCGWIHREDGLARCKIYASPKICRNSDRECKK